MKSIFINWMQKYQKLFPRKNFKGWCRWSDTSWCREICKMKTLWCLSVPWVDGYAWQWYQLRGQWKLLPSSPWPSLPQQLPEDNQEDPGWSSNERAAAEVGGYSPTGWDAGRVGTLNWRTAAQDRSEWRKLCDAAIRLYKALMRQRLLESQSFDFLLK